MKVVICLLCLLVAGCEQWMARGLGGSARVSLPAGAKLIGVTWKGSDLWMLTRKAKEGEAPEAFVFGESSTFGVLQGEVVIQEVRR